MRNIFILAMAMALVSITIAILQQRPELLTRENIAIFIVISSAVSLACLAFTLRSRISYAFINKKELGVSEIANLLGIRSMTPNGNYVIVQGTKLIGHSYVAVTKVPYFIEDMEKEKKLWFIQNFARVLQTISFPFEMIVRGFPLSAESEIKRVQREIDDVRMRLYVEKGMENPGAQAKLKRLEREHERLLSGEGIRAVSFLVHLLVQGDNTEKIANELDSNTKTLTVTLESTLGVRVSRLSGSDMLRALKEFFRASAVVVPKKIWKAFTWDLSYLIPFTQPKLPSLDQLLHGVYLGRTTGNIPVGIDLSKQNNPHLCLLGITGSGKSVTAKSLITRYHDKYQSKILVIDYAGEYAPWVTSRSGTIVDMSKNSINPFELGPEPLLVKIQQVVETFEVICELNLIQTNAFHNYVERAYESRGFKLHDESTWKGKAPDLAEIIETMEKRVLSLSGPEQATVQSLLRRLRPLVQGPFGVFRKSSLSLANLTQGFVCLDLSKLASNSLKDVVAWSVFQYIDSTMRLKGQRSEISLIICIEEAYRICMDPRAIPVTLIKEGRKYGYAVIVIAQDLLDLAPQIVANVGTIIVHRITHPRYVRFLEKQLGLAQNEVERLRNLDRGEALVKLSTDAKPFFVRVDMEKVEELPIIEPISQDSNLYDKLGEKQAPLESLEVIRAPLTNVNNKGKISENAQKLLETIREGPGLRITEYYKKLGFNSFRGNKAKEELAKLGLVEARELPRVTGKGRYGKILSLTEKAQPLQEETKRFGGELHRHLVHLLSSKLSEKGLDVEVEAPLGSGKLADIVVNRKIAFEVETREFKEENITKNLDAGLEKVVIVCQTQKLVERMKAKLAEKGLVSNVVVVDLSSLIRNLEHYLDRLGLEVKKVELRTRNR